MNNLEKLISDWQRDADSLSNGLSNMIDGLIRAEKQSEIHKLRCDIYEYKVRIFEIKECIRTLKKAIESDNAQKVNPHE